MGLKYAKSKDKRSTLWATVFEDRVARNKQFTHWLHQLDLSPLLSLSLVSSLFLGLPKHRQQFTRINCVLLFRNSGISREMDLLCFCGGTQSSLRHKPYRRRKAAQAISFDPKNRIWRQSPKCSFTIFYRFFFVCVGAARRVQLPFGANLFWFCFYFYFSLHRDRFAREPFHPKALQKNIASNPTQYLQMWISEQRQPHSCRRPRRWDKNRTRRKYKISDFDYT